MTSKTNEFTKAFNDIADSFPFDGTEIQDALKNQTALAEKLSQVALNAAEKSAEITNNWTKETLSKSAALTSAKDDPAEYSKALTDFSSEQTEVSSQALSAYAELAKQVQEETIQLVLAASQDFSKEAAAAAKKAEAKVTSAAKKATKK